MKKCIVILLSSIFLTSFATTNISSSKSYDIAKIYEIVQLESDSKVLDSYGHIDDAEYVLIPTSIDYGKYEVELTKIAFNFYRIYGTDLVIETKYCYEYANREDVILNIKSSYGSTIGEVIFLD